MSKQRQDPEIKAIDAIARLLRPLDQAARQRAIKLALRLANHVEDEKPTSVKAPRAVA